MSKLLQYMVDFSLPIIMEQQFVDLIPDQRAKVNECFVKGQISAYTLSMENGRLWAVVNAKNQREVLDIIASFPLSKYMEWKIYPLTFHQTIENAVMTFSLN